MWLGLRCIGCVCGCGGGRWFGIVTSVGRLVDLLLAKLAECVVVLVACVLAVLAVW